MTPRPLLSVAILALAAAAAATASDPQNSSSARFMLAQYMRVVPAGPTDAQHCARVCVKTRSAGDKAEPVCVEWKKVC